jgi:hypothetical protein
MKRIVLNVLAGVLMMAAFSACGGGGGGSFGGGSYKIKMTHEYNNFGFYLAGSGVATVNWGDGSEKVSRTLDEDRMLFEHAYPNASIRTITVNGDNIEIFDCRTYLTELDVRGVTALTYLGVRGDLTSLDVSKNTVLTQLSVGGNFTNLDVSKNMVLTSLGVSSKQLTSLNVSKNTALIYLNVENNQLTAAALNALFGTLHGNIIEEGLYGYPAKFIRIHDNPGTDTCDRNIAERKGWTVY